MGENSENIGPRPAEKCESVLRSNAGNGYELLHAGTRHDYFVPNTGARMILCLLHADMLGDAVKLGFNDPATDDDVNVLVDRIVRRAQYVALREVLAVLDVDGRPALLNHDGVRRMLNDAARNLGTALPVTAADE